MKHTVRITVVLTLLSILFFLPENLLYSDADIPGIVLEKDPVDIAINPLTDEAVAVNEKSDTVSIVELDTGQVIATIPVGKRPTGVAIDSEMNLVLVADKKDNTATLINLNTQEAVSTIPVGREPVSVAISPLNHTGLVVNHKDDSISVIDLQTYTVITTISAGREPIDIAIDPVLNIALVANEKHTGHEDEEGEDEVEEGDEEEGYTVSVIDLNTYEVIDEIPVGKKPQAVDINPETHIAVVANEKDNSITIIDLQTMQTHNMPVEKHPVDVAINPLDNRVLVICKEDRKLLLIDLNTETVIEEYTINKKSEAVAVNPYTNVAGVVDTKTDSLTLIQLPNPVPVITSIAPDTITRGSGDTTILIQGSGFIRSSSVYLKLLTSDFLLPLSFIDNHHIEATIPEELLQDAGIYELSVINPSPEGGESDTVELTIENPLPSITVLEPPEALSGTPSVTLTLTGIGFFDDTVVYVDGVSRTFTYIDHEHLEITLTGSELEAGGYLDISAFNPSPGGGSSNTMTFTVLNPVPVLTSIEPDTVMAGSGDLTLTLTGDNFVSSSVVEFNGQQYPVTYIDKGHVEAVIPSSSIEVVGDYPVKVINPSPGGGESDSATLTVTNPVEVVITSPSDGAVVNTPDVEIHGTATSTYPITTVSVNGIQAVISGSDFTASISLTQGSNTITALATDSMGHTASTSITVTYEPSVTPPPVTEASGFIDGYVYDSRADQPLSGVTITVEGVTGAVLTDSNGFFAFPVSDFPPDIPAKEVLLTAEKDGYTYAQRRVVVRSRLDVRADDIYLVPRDSLTTTITPDGGIATNSRGNIILEFPPGAVDTPIEVNITEYDHSRELPSPLPATSHFTFAADFLPDGVTFNQPVHLKVENFLDFPAGTPVPVGYYDRQKGAWIPDGMGVISDDGQWMEYDLTHFSLFDLNFAASNGSPPPSSGGNEGNDGGCGNGCCVAGSGGGPGGTQDHGMSSVSVRSGVLGVEHELPDYRLFGKGFHLTLRYNSNLAHPQIFIGRRADYSSFTPMPDLIAVEIDFMGQRKAGFFQPSDRELSFRALFEPRNDRGTEIPTGIYPYRISLYNLYYNLSYATTDEFGGYPLAPLPPGIREPRYTSRDFYGQVYVKNDVIELFGKGWSIDGIRELLKTPYGQIALVNGGGYELFGGMVIKTVAGNGMVGYNGDNIPAIEAQITGPRDVLLDNDGNIYIADAGNKRVRKVDTNGIITTVAGNGGSGYGGDGGLATETRIGSPLGLAIDREGNLYISTANHRVLKVDTDGIITTVAGTGEQGYNGDGIPATEAYLFEPVGLEIDDAGNLYIADRRNHRVRRVSPDGIITTVAGNGGTVFGGGDVGDGGPATEARVSYPTDVALDSQGNLYIVGSYKGRLRKVDQSGIITTVAGGGQQSGYSGEGGPATEATLPDLNAVEIDDEDNIYLAIDKRVVKVDNNGIIYTVAGNGEWGLTEEGAAPTSTSIPDPRGIAVDKSGAIYIADKYDDKILKLTKVYNSSSSTVFESSRENGTTLTVNPDGTYTLRYRDGVVVEFNPEGLQTSLTDRNGNTTQYIYDTNQRLTQIIDPAGGITTFNYTNGYLSSITDPQGRTTTFTIDANGDLVSITDPDGSVTTYSYDSRHLMTSKTLPGNRTYTYTYDSHGMVSEVTFPDGSRRHYRHSMGMGLLNDIESSTDNPAPPVITDQLYDEVVDELGNVTRYRTDRYGFSIEEVDPLGRVTITERDEHSRVTKVIYPDGSQVTKEYDEIGNLIKETDALGNVTTYTYEPDFNQVSTITDPKGNVTSFEYDANGNLIKTTDPLGNVTTMAYDSRGLLTSVTDANGGIIQYEYDAAGNLIKTIDQLGNATTYTRDSAGNIISVTDAEGNVTVNEYDSMNRLVSVIDANGGVTSYTYTSGGCASGCSGSSAGKLLSSITDANGNTTSFEYDERDRLARIINPLGNVTTYEYDSKGNLIKRIDPNGNVIRYEYDSAGRLIKKTTPDDIVSYTYDSRDNLVFVSDNDSSLTMTYDSNGRLLSVTTGGTTQPSVTITYTYDAKGNRVSMTSPIGTTTYTYDSSNRLTSITDPTGKVYSFAYDSLGRRTSLSYPNGVTTSYAYDISSRLTELVTRDPQLATLNSYAYNYDTVGNRTAMTELTGTHNYTYDSLYQLTDAVHPIIPSEQFSYDPVGNRLSDAYNNTYTYNAGNQLLSYDGVSFEYDANGNVISRTDATGTTTYTYDSENRLIQLITPNSELITYKYDPFGRRIEKDVNGVITKYVYDGENILLEYDGSNTLVASYTHNLGIDDPLAVEISGQKYYYHKDALGSIVAMTDESGNIVQTYEYDSFGNITSQMGSIDQPFTYTGREYDAESGLYYYRARYYDARAGRFLSEDPILRPMNLSCSSLSTTSPELTWILPFLMHYHVNFNGYVYVRNNPLNYIDPLGFAYLAPPGFNPQKCVEYCLAMECESKRCEGSWAGTSYVICSFYCVLRCVSLFPPVYTK
jgi:RHS repeat-associated protein